MSQLSTITAGGAACSVHALHIKSHSMLYTAGVTTFLREMCCTALQVLAGRCHLFVDYGSSSWVVKLVVLVSLLVYMVKFDEGCSH